MSNGNKWEWANPIEIHALGAREIEIDPSALERYIPGSFTFADGGVSGWSLDQLYDADTALPTLLPSFPVPPQVSSGFTLSNYQSLGLAASTHYLLAAKSAQMVGFYFVSPDLKGLAGWTDCTGYRLDFYRDYFCWLNSPALHLAQMQAEFSDKTNSKNKVVTEIDATTGSPAFHQIAHAQSYAFSWQADEFKDAKLELRRIRIFCKLVNVAAVAGADLASGSSGDWRIGNVRPLH